MKSLKVRVTYLASGLEWMWDLEWGAKMLDSKEGANSCAGNAGFEGRKETSLMFLSKLESKSSHRGFALGSKGCHSRLSFWVWTKRLCAGCSSESKETEVCGFFRIKIGERFWFFLFLRCWWTWEFYCCVWEDFGGFVPLVQKILLKNMCWSLFIYRRALIWF